MMKERHPHSELLLLPREQKVNKKEREKKLEKKKTEEVGKEEKKKVYSEPHRSNYKHRCSVTCNL